MALRDDIISALCALPSSDFVSEYLFDRTPYLFGSDRAGFVKWKTKLAKALEVDPACVSFVGSSALGVSLNPNNGFRPFDDKSDVDVAVISAFHFTVAWRFLRTNGHQRVHVDVRTRIAWDDHVHRLIYWGTIATDRLLGVLPFGAAWLSALNTMSNTPPTVGRDINLRIYADHDSLRAYQFNSVKRAREEAMAGGGAHAPLS